VARLFHPFVAVDASTIILAVMGDYGLALLIVFVASYACLAFVQHVASRRANA
jgi:hypothetical protein